MQPTDFKGLCDVRWSKKEKKGESLKVMSSRPQAYLNCINGSSSIITCCPGGSAPPATDVDRN